MNREIGAPSSTSARAQTSPRDGPGGAGAARFRFMERAPTPYFARIGTMNRDGAVVGQPSRLSSRASRPRRILGRDACPTTARFMERLFNRAVDWFSDSLVTAGRQARAALKE